METEKTLLRATLCFLRRENEVMLALKKRKIGEGCLNGYGGGIEDGEKIKITAARELKEESGGVIALPEDLVEAGIVDFHNTKSDGTFFVCRVFVYSLWKWQGEAKDTDEMVDPKCYDVRATPFWRMMPADRFWFPIFMDKMSYAIAYYGPRQETLLKPVEIVPINSFSEIEPEYELLAL